MGTVEAGPIELERPWRDEQGRITGWEEDPCFVCSIDDLLLREVPLAWEALALAMSRAGDRFGLVDEDGNEITYDELGSGAYTPNYVSDPSLSTEGAYLTADTKSAPSREMVERMLAVLVEELTRLPIDTHVICRWPEVGGVEWRGPHTEPSGAGSQDRVVRRDARCIVRDGVPGVVTEYLDDQDRWTTARDEARVFEPGQRGHAGTWDLAVRLRRDMLERGHL